MKSSEIVQMWRANSKILSENTSSCNFPKELLFPSSLQREKISSCAFNERRKAFIFIFLRIGRRTKKKKIKWNEMELSWNLKMKHEHVGIVLQLSVSVNSEDVSPHRHFDKSELKWKPFKSSRVLAQKIYIKSLFLSFIHMCQQTVCRSLKFYCQCIIGFSNRLKLSHISSEATMLLKLMNSDAECQSMA